jgi:hypothetical protein
MQHFIGRSRPGPMFDQVFLDTTHDQQTKEKGTVMTR